MGSRLRRSSPCRPASATALASKASPRCWRCSRRARRASPWSASTTGSARPAPRCACARCTTDRDRRSRDERRLVPLLLGHRRRHGPRQRSSTRAPTSTRCASSAAASPSVAGSSRPSRCMRGGIGGDAGHRPHRGERRRADLGAHRRADRGSPTPRARATTRARPRSTPSPRPRVASTGALPSRCTSTRSAGSTRSSTSSARAPRSSCSTSTRCTPAPSRTGIGMVRGRPRPAAQPCACGGRAAAGRADVRASTSPSSSRRRPARRCSRRTSSRWGPLPAMTIEATGFGAGGRELDGRPNLTQVVVGQPSPTRCLRVSRSRCSR